MNNQDKKWFDSLAGKKEQPEKKNCPLTALEFFKALDIVPVDMPAVSQETHFLEQMLDFSYILDKKYGYKLTDCHYTAAGITAEFEDNAGRKYRLLWEEQWKKPKT